MNINTLESETEPVKVWIDTLIYLATGILQKAGGFLLLPILVATLPPADFTRYGLFISIVQVLSKGASLNLHSAPTRLVFDYGSHKKQASMLKTSLLGALAGVCVTVGLLVATLRLFSIEDPVTQGENVIYIVVFGSVFGTVGAEYGLAVFRIYRKPISFSIVSIGKSVGPVVLYLGLTGLITGSFFHVGIAYVTSLLLVGGGAVWWTRLYRQSGHVDAGMFWEGVRFSFPTFLNFLGIWMVGMSGRWIGTWFMPLSELADYTLLTFIVAGAGMAGRALFHARIPGIGSAFASEEIQRGRRIIFQTTSITAVLVLLGYLLAFVGLNFFGFLVPDAYRPTNALLSIALAASMFDCLYLYGIQSLIALKRTEVMPIATGVGAICVVLLSMVLAYYLGEIGLITAMAIGYSVQGGLSIFLSRRMYHDVVA